MLLVGCAWKKTPGEAADPAQAWQPRPTTMRVFPSSRFVSLDGQPVLEARVEITDEMGDAVKAAGTYRFDIYGRGPTGALDLTGPKLYAWAVPILTLDDQQSHFDRVTGAYLFRLKLYDEATAQRGAVLRVVLMPVEGDRLESVAALGGLLPH